MRQLLGPLAIGQATPLRRWLGEQGLDVDTLRTLPDWAARTSVNDGPIEAVLAHQLPLAAKVPGGLPLLLVWLHHEVNEAWEVSYQYLPMWATLRGAVAIAEAEATVAAAELPAVSAAAALLRGLDHRIQQENALTSGALAQLAHHADQAAACAGQARDQARALAPDLRELAGYLTALAGFSECYDRAVAVAARGLAAFWARGEPLTSAITALRTAEATLQSHGRPEANELRAHRFSLLALQERTAEGWLRVDSGTVTAIYPFHLAGLSPAEVLDRLDTDPPTTLGGAAVGEVARSLRLDDIWKGSDWLGRRYGGARLTLPELTVRAGDGSPLATLTAEIHLSTLGNHYVRFEEQIASVNPSQLHAALLRAAPEHGIVEIGFDDTNLPGSARLADCATNLAEELGEQLGAQVSARPGMYHVVAVVHTASVVTSDGDAREIRSPAELAGVAGAEVVTNAATHCLGSLAEWATYEAGAAVTPLAGLGLPGTAVIPTRNTTVLVDLGAPEFSAATRATVAEFVASLDGLFTGWQRELSQTLERIRRQQSDEPEAGGSARRQRPEPADDAVRRIEADQTRVQLLAIEIRSIVGLVSSPTLVASPTVAALLDRLLVATEFRRRVSELERNLAEVVEGWLVLHERDARRRLALQERRRRARMDTLLAVIAAVGLSGLGQIIQSGFALTGWGAVWVTLVIVAIIAGVGLSIWRIVRRESAEPAT